MDNRAPSSRKVGKGKRAEDQGPPVEKETRVLHETATPEEHDPLWNELGSTRVIDESSDSADDGELASPANLTPMSPGHVLGQDIVELGGFKLIKKLGEGAMGAVYKAQQPEYNRNVALKILFAHVANNEKLVKRFYREAEVMFKLDPPNIIHSYAVDQAEGCHYVAMEYVSGQSTQKWVTQLGRMPEDVLH